MCRCSVNVMHWFTPAALFEPPKFCIVLAPTRKYFLVMVSYRHGTLNGSTIMWEFPIRSINVNIYWRGLQSNISFIFNWFTKTVYKKPSIERTLKISVLSALWQTQSCSDDKFLITEQFDTAKNKHGKYLKS